MRIALTHNLRLTDSEDEAEFDSRETIDALTAALERLGHRVERIEVSGPASRTAARIEAYSPELIFNTAEGRRGRFREAFYPALFDELGFPYTGSDAWVLAVTLDKSLTKLMLSEHGVISPRGQFIDDIVDLKLDGWRFPLIVKPNFEGSSKGITQDSVCEERGRLRALVEKTLARFPAGVLVEEFIPGKDLTVAFLEKAAPERQGVLTPVEYVIDEAELSKRRYRIYDYDLKSVHHEAARTCRLHLQREAHQAGDRRPQGRGGGVRSAADHPGGTRGHRRGRPRGDRPRGDHRASHRPRGHAGRRGLQHGGRDQGAESRSGGAGAPRASRHPLFGIGSHRALHRPRQGDRQAHRPPARDPHPQFHDPHHREGAASPRPQVPAHREAERGRVVEGRSPHERRRYRGGIARGGAGDDRQVRSARPGRGLHRRARVHRRSSRRAQAKSIAADGGGVPRRRGASRLLVRVQAGLVEQDPLRRPGAARAGATQGPRARGPRMFHRTRVPRRRPERLPHGLAGPGLFPRVQSAARPDDGLERPGAHRDGGGHR